MDAQGLDTRLAHVLAVMGESRLIGLESLRPWADAWILKLDAPPAWLLELCTARELAEAVRILSDAAGSPSSESLDTDERADVFVACLLLRYRRGDLSWATFLREAGQRLDAANGHRPCEDLYALLTELERHADAKALESLQRAQLEREFHEALERVESVRRLLEGDP